jgi:K+-sensing histidine kinase KdpD
LVGVGNGEEGFPVRHQVEAGRPDIESFAIDLLRIASDPDTSFERKLQEFLVLGCERFGLEIGILAKVEGAKYTIRQVCCPDDSLQPGQTFDLGDTYCEQTIAAAGPVGFALAANPQRGERHPAYRPGRLEAYLGVPIHVEERLYGTLNFSSRSPRPADFTDQEMQLIELMGRWVARELTRRRTEQALRRKDRALERLLEATNRMHTDLSLDRVLQQVTDSALHLLGCRYAALGVLNPDGKGLAEFASSGMTEEERRRIRSLPVGKGLLGVVIDDPRPHRVTDVGRHPKSVGFPDHHPPMKSFLGVPVLGAGGPIGNLYCGDKLTAEEFSAEDEEVAQGLAAEAAIAIENARLVTKLRTLQVTRNRFYAMVNHELRNALTGVYGWAELLLRKSGERPPRAVRETVESAEYALELLNDLLDLSRFDANRIEPEVIEADALEIVQDAVATVQPSARDAGVKIEVRSPRHLPCRTDPKRVRQILINLLRNAVRHSGDDSVMVEMDGGDSKLVFSVIDQGEGISPEQQEIIFDAFARANSKVAGGTGLGLTLSRRLAVMLGGNITVQSQLGQGARFTVTIARYLS